MACSSFLQAQLAELTAAVQKSFSSPHLWQQRIYVSSSGRLYEKSGLLNWLFILIDKIWRLLTFKKSSSVTQNLEKKICSDIHCSDILCLALLRCVDL